MSRQPSCCSSKTIRNIKTAKRIVNKSVYTLKCSWWRTSANGKGLYLWSFCETVLSRFNNSPWPKAREGLGASADLHPGDRTVRRVLRISSKISRALSCHNVLFLVERAFSVVQGWSLASLPVPRLRGLYGTAFPMCRHVVRTESGIFKTFTNKEHTFMVFSYVSSS